MRLSRGSLRWWLLGFAVWTGLAVLSVTQSAVWLEATDRHVDWGGLALSRGIDWYTCAIFTPVFWWTVRRWPIDRLHWRLAAPLHLAVTSVVVVLKYAIYVPLMEAVAPGLWQLTFRQTLAANFISENIAFWCVIGVVHAIFFYERFREREVQAARLRAQLSEAQLEALAAQLHPHFLFNTLQGISTLIHRDPGAADTMLTQLSELLRRTLGREGGHEVTLKEELALLENYLGIVQGRFQDRLCLEREVPSGLEDALVPHFILQPLVENAIQHGIARRAGAGRLAVSARQQGGMLVLNVEDDGPGLHSPAREFPREGVGLSNTRRRLAQLYGERQGLELVSRKEGGLTVTVRLPYHLTPVTNGSEAP